MVWEGFFEEILEKAEGATPQDLEHGLAEWREGIPPEDKKIFKQLDERLHEDYREDKYSLPQRKFPDSYIDFLTYANGGIFLHGERELSVFSLEEAKSSTLDHQMPYYMAGAVCFAEDVDGNCFVFDMRKDSVNDEYDIYAVSHETLGWGYEEAALLGNSFVEVMKEEEDLNSILHRNFEEDYADTELILAGKNEEAIRSIDAKISLYQTDARLISKKMAALLNLQLYEEVLSYAEYEHVKAGIAHWFLGQKTAAIALWKKQLAEARFPRRIDRIIMPVFFIYAGLSMGDAEMVEEAMKRMDLEYHTNFKTPEGYIDAKIPYIAGLFLEGASSEDLILAAKKHSTGPRMTNANMCNAYFCAAVNDWRMNNLEAYHEHLVKCVEYGEKIYTNEYYLAKYALTIGCQ